MSSTAIILWTLIPMVTVVQFYNHWCIGQGNLNHSYRLSMIAYSIYFIIECMLASRDIEQMPLLILNTLNVWAFMMAYKGYKRLKEEENEKCEGE